MNRRSLLHIAMSTLALTTVSCGDTFDPISLIGSLRVLAVRAEPAFARPGGEIDLEILVHDGSPSAIREDATPRPIQIVWFGGCHNPPGDVFYACIPELAARFAALQQGAPPAPGAFGLGPTFTATFPEDVITGRPAPPPGTIPYGRSFAFFAACAGEVRAAAPSEFVDALPLECVDEAGAVLGPEDFVVGYFPMFSYESLTNDNPTVRGVTVNGREPSNAACGPAPCPSGERCGSAGTCLPVIAHCTREVQDDCPEHENVPLVDRASVELDPAAETSDGVVPEESLWVSFYTTAGKISRESALVNDSAKGWTDDFASALLAPLEPTGEVRLFVVAHDNRGGGAWIEQDVFVE